MAKIYDLGPEKEAFPLKFRARFCQGSSYIQPLNIE